MARAQTWNISCAVFTLNWIVDWPVAGKLRLTMSGFKAEARKKQVHDECTYIREKEENKQTWKFGRGGKKWRTRKVYREYDASENEGKENRFYTYNRRRIGYAGEEMKRI